MSEHDLSELLRLIRELTQKLDDHDYESIDRELHLKHHEFMQAIIDREKLNKERWEALRRWGMFGIIGWIGLHLADLGVWVWHVVIEKLTGN